MHVLVTGATGFVGNRLVPALSAAGHEGRVLLGDQATDDPPAGRSPSVASPPVHGLTTPAVERALSRTGGRTRHGPVSVGSIQQ
jgi:nucleoside-diphosphate-sugar epimerase